MSDETHPTVEEQEQKQQVSQQDATLEPSVEEKTQGDIDNIEDNTNNEKQDDDGAPKTVFDDPKEFNVKHPLQNTWTLWFDNPGKKANATNWSENLKEIVNVNTVEDFWG